MDDVKVKKNKNSDHLGIMHPCSTTKERIRSPANIYKQTNTHIHIPHFFANFHNVT